MDPLESFTWPQDKFSSQTSELFGRMNPNLSTKSNRRLVSSQTVYLREEFLLQERRTNRLPDSVTRSTSLQTAREIS